MPENNKCLLFWERDQLCRVDVYFPNSVAFVLFPSVIVVVCISKTFYRDSSQQLFVISYAVYFRRMDVKFWITVRRKGTSPFLNLFSIYIFFAVHGLVLFSFVCTEDMFTLQLYWDSQQTSQKCEEIPQRTLNKNRRADRAETHILIQRWTNH